MDNSDLDNLSAERQQQLAQLQSEIEGQELTVLLEKLMERYELSVNGLAVAAGMDESALHKILKGENREFKAEYVDELLNYLEDKCQLTDSHEKSIWRRALRVASFLHFDLYKAVEIRLRQIADPVERVKALAEYLRTQYPALAETYDQTGGRFPIFVPLFDVVARQLLKRWEWIRVPDGYQISKIESDHYHLISKDLFPKKITDLGPDLEVKDTGFGTYEVRRRVAQVQRPSMPQRVAKDRIVLGMVLGSLEFVGVPKGKFLMGSKGDNKLAWEDEKPQHSVEIPYDYWIARYPVTNDQFATFVKARRYQTDAEKAGSDYVWWHPHGRDSGIGGKGDHPVVQVSWHDAMEYCKWLNELARDNLAKGSEPSPGLIVRLPTEAEWEKAARGEYGNEWPWGNEFDKNKCNSYEGGKGGTTPVGAYSPQGDSPYGVSDMVGNVWEWCATKWQNSYQSYVDDNDLSGDALRVVRGGSFDYDRRGARVAYRFRDVPDSRSGNQGFRVVVAPRLS